MQRYTLFLICKQKNTNTISKPRPFHAVNHLAEIKYFFSRTQYIAQRNVYHIKHFPNKPHSPTKTIPTL